MRTWPGAVLGILLLPAVTIAQGTVVGIVGEQTPAVPTSNTSPEQRCVLAGRVTNSLTGEPIKKAALHLNQRGGPGAVGAQMNQQGYSATSEADGSFRIEGIEPGNYALSGQRQGFLNTHYGARAPLQQGSILTLAPGQQLTNIDLGLTPQAVVTGKVVDEDGDPVANVMISVLVHGWQRGKPRLMPRGGNQTNDLGEFRVANLSPGKYYLCAQRAGFMDGNSGAPNAGKPDVRPVRTCYPDAASIQTATTLDIKAGQDLSGMDIRLRSAQTYHIRGRVIGTLPEGQSEQRMMISLSSQGEEFMGFGGAQTNISKDRSFDIAGVAPGSYNLNLMLMGGQVRVLGRQPVDIGQGDVNDLVLPIVPPGSLKGQIHIEGTPSAGTAAPNLASIRIGLIPIDMGLFVGQMSGANPKPDGSFTVDNITAGKYALQANPPTGTYLKSVRFAQQELLGKELDLAQSTSGELEITFRYGAGEVDGTIQASQSASDNSTSSGQRASTPSATVVLVPDALNPDGSGMRFGSTTQGANFTIKQVPPGHYRAYAFEQMNMNQLQNPDLLKQLEPKGTDVTVGENDIKRLQLSIISADELQQVFAALGMEPQ